MKWWGGKNKEDRVGFYTTLVFHLSVLVILLIVSIGHVATSENTFVLDFTRQEELVDMNPQQGVESSEPAPAYQGPSVISYELEGRKALSLPVPAYKGYGAGDVLVDIEVNPAGRVTAAKVRADGSSADASLHSFAVDAARRSRFSASADAAKSQPGWILYRFIAQ